MCISELKREVLINVTALPAQVVRLKLSSYSLGYHLLDPVVGGGVHLHPRMAGAGARSLLASFLHITSSAALCIVDTHSVVYSCCAATLLRRQPATGREPEEDSSSYYVGTSPGHRGSRG